MRLLTKSGSHSTSEMTWQIKELLALTEDQGMSPQHPNGALSPSVTPVPGNPMSLALDL